MGRRQKGRKNGVWFSLHGPAPVAPCHWCGRPLTFRQSTLDHEPALAEGGTRHQTVIACYACNQRRGAETQKRVCARKRVRRRPAG